MSYVFSLSNLRLAIEGSTFSHLATRLPAAASAQAGHSPLCFRPIMLPCNPFRCNTCKTSCKCSFQKTYSKAKSFRMRTYKKPGVGLPWRDQSSLCASVPARPTGGSLWPARRGGQSQSAVVAPLEPRCFPTANAVYLSSLHTLPGCCCVTTGGYTPTPSSAGSLFSASVSLWLPCVFTSGLQ